MEEREITIRITAKNVQTVLDGLNELPHKISRDLFDNIRRQTIEQLFPKAKADGEKQQDNASST